MKKVLAIALMLCAPAQAQDLTLMGVGGGRGAAAFVGPADVIASPVAFWGLRAMSAATTGTRTANICNTSDANCADINSLANGNFDVTTAQAAPLNCTTNCTVKTLYDQSGNGNNITNATIANRPSLVFSCLGSKPCMQAAGSATLTSATFSSSAAQPYTLMAVASCTAASSCASQNTFMQFNTAGVQFLFGPTSAANAVGLYSGNVLPSVTSSASTVHSVIGVYNGASSILSNDGGTNTVNVGTPQNTLGGPVAIPVNSGNPFTGQLFEAGVWTTPSPWSTTNVTDMAHNQCAYWGTPAAC